MRKTINFVIGLLGVAIIISGHYIRNGDRYPWVIDLFAPRYNVVKNAFEEMLLSADPRNPLQARKILRTNDAGFAEMIEILRADFPELERANAEQIRIGDIGLAAGGYWPDKGVSYSGVQPNFEITLSGGNILRRYTFDLRPEIRKRFLEDPLYTWGTRLVWIGAAVTITSLIRAAILG
jgi:hypothetical protein